MILPSQNTDKPSFTLNWEGSRLDGGKGLEQVHYCFLFPEIASGYRLLAWADKSVVPWVRERALWSSAAVGVKVTISTAPTLRQATCLL